MAVRIRARQISIPMLTSRNNTDNTRAKKDNTMTMRQMTKKYEQNGNIIIGNKVSLICDIFKATDYVCMDIGCYHRGTTLLNSLRQRK